MSRKRGGGPRGLLLFPFANQSKCAVSNCLLTSVQIFRFQALKLVEVTINPSHEPRKPCLLSVQTSLSMYCTNGTPLPPVEPVRDSHRFEFVHHRRLEVTTHT